MCVEEKLETSPRTEKRLAQKGEQRNHQAAALLLEMAQTYLDDNNHFRNYHQDKQSSVEGSILDGDRANMLSSPTGYEDVQPE